MFGLDYVSQVKGKTKVRILQVIDPYSDLQFQTLVIPNN